MAKIVKSALQNPVNLALASIFLSLGMAGMPVAAVTLTPSAPVLDSEIFPSISQDFLASNLVGLDNLSLVAFQGKVELEQLKIVLENNPLDLNNSYISPLSLDSVASSLKRIKIEAKPRQLEEDDIPTVSQTNAANVYEDIYGIYTAVQPQPKEELVGKLDVFKSSPISLTNPPKNYFYNNNSVSVSILQPPRLSENFLAPATAQGVANVSLPSVQKTVRVNTLSPQLHAENDSTLQLWPRNPFDLEVSEGLANLSSASFVNTESYGTLNIDVNFPTMPKEVFLTVFDLSVDWTNTGGYSQNLRSNVDTMTEYHRQQQVKFQEKVERSRQLWTKQQQAYQNKVQQGVSKQYSSPKPTQLTPYATTPRNYRPSSPYAPR